MTDEKVDIHDEVAAICDKLGLDYTNVAHLDIEPRRVVATVFRLKGGAKFVSEEIEAAATELFTFPVST